LATRPCIWKVRLFRKSLNLHTPDTSTEFCRELVVVSVAVVVTVAVAVVV